MIDRTRPICLDIETAGCLRGVDTTQFHPVKLLHWDGVKAKDVLVSCALSWWTAVAGGSTPQTPQVQSAWFNLRNPIHRRRLVSWLAWIQKNRVQLLIQNAVYDLTFLRYFLPASRPYLAPPTRLADLMVASYLVDELRPERSLKALAPLLLGAEGLYTDDQRSLDFLGPDDPALAAYNVADTSRTLRCFDICRESYSRLYGKSTAKGTSESDEWYSTVLHLVTRMSETGVPIKVPELRALHRRLTRGVANVVKHSAKRFDLILKGKGSDGSKRDVIQQALRTLALAFGPDLEDSDIDKYVKPTKTGKLPFDGIARAALLERLPKSDATYKVRCQLRIMGAYQDMAKILSTYTGPMLRGRTVRGKQDNSPRVVRGRVYPVVFPVPREFGNVSGGTKQGRLSAKDPSVPTFPKMLKKLLDCDVWVDYSQIELRTGALLSNDPVMVAEYQGKPDLHSRTAKLIFGDDIVKHPQFKTKYRQTGKVINFLMLYRGGAEKFQRSVLDGSGVEMPLDDCKAAIERFWQTYRGLKEWQDRDLIAYAEKHGFLEMPISGVSRRFVKSHGTKGRHRDKESLPINEICNMPVQWSAAMIMLSAQAEMWRLADVRGWGITLPVNIYDATGFVLSPRERRRYGISRVLELIHEVMPNPPFYRALTSHLGRAIPLGYEVFDRNHTKILEV